MSLSLNNNEEKRCDNDTYGDDILLDAFTENQKTSIVPTQVASNGKNTDEKPSVLRSIFEFIYVIIILAIPFICVALFDAWASGDLGDTAVEGALKILLPAGAVTFIILLIISIWATTLHADIFNKYTKAILIAVFAFTCLFVMQNPSQNEYLPFVYILFAGLMFSIIIGFLMRLFRD